LVLKHLGLKSARAGLGDIFEPVDSQLEARQSFEVASRDKVGEGSAGSELAEAGQAEDGLDRRFRWALVLYCVLGLLVWFTMGEGKVLVQGRPVELRLVPLIVIGGLALRTVVAHRAEKIRRGE
jgi:hypothetical protein